MGKMVVTILLAVAQAAHHRISERTNEGRIKAKTKGIKFGCKQTIDREKIRALHFRGGGATQLAKQVGIGRSTVYKVFKELARVNCNLIFVPSNLAYGFIPLDFEHQEVPFSLKR